MTVIFDELLRPPSGPLRSPVKISGRGIPRHRASTERVKKQRSTTPEETLLDWGPPRDITLPIANLCREGIPM